MTDEELWDQWIQESYGMAPSLTEQHYWLTQVEGTIGSDYSGEKRAPETRCKRLRRRVTKKWLARQGFPHERNSEVDPWIRYCPWFVQHDEHGQWVEPLVWRGFEHWVAWRRAQLHRRRHQR